MLKIPAPPENHFIHSKTFGPSNSTLGVSNSSHSSHSASGSSLGGRRSCQTCQDKNTERKRYLSKSREAIFEKVTNSNLKKSLSKSRERLCDIRLSSLSKSRDHLNDGNKIAVSRSQGGFKSLSKSQEVS